MTDQTDYVNQKIGSFLTRKRPRIIFDTAYISRELQRSRDVSGDPASIPAFDYSSVVRFFNTYSNHPVEPIAVVHCPNDQAFRKSEGLRRTLVSKNIQIVINNDPLGSVGFALCVATSVGYRSHDYLFITDDKGISSCLSGFPLLVGPDSWNEDIAGFLLQNGLGRFIKFSDFAEMTGANVMTISEIRGLTNKKMWEPAS